MTPEERVELLEALGVISFAFDQAYGFSGVLISPKREHALHESLHLMTLGMTFNPTHTFHGVSDSIGNSLGPMGERYARENELRVLAAELRVLRALQALTKTGERRFLGRVARTQKIRSLRRVVTQLAEEHQAKEDAERVVRLILGWAYDLQFVTAC